MSENSISLKERAQKLRKMCGTWAAARFLAKRDVPLNDALMIFGFPQR
mgnify:CR=1 FL=1